MGSMDSAFGGNFEGGFEPDDFYESFLAPKFHDFTAPEEPIDPDAYFMAKPGMLKKAFATVEDVKPVAPKIHKAAPQEAPKAVTAQAPPKSPVAAEKIASSTGSAKKATRVIATAVTPLASKPLKNGNNSPAHPTMQEKQSNSNNGSLKPTSLAKKLQASENDDPNSPTNNNSPDAAAPKPTKQRSTKAPEEKPALTRQRSQKILETKPERKTSVESNISKESGVKKTGARTPVKEAKPCAEAAGSGHYCKSSRCAANDPNLASPVPAKKYLVAKVGTPGSLKKTIPERSEKSESATESVKAKVALEDVFQRMDLEPEEKKHELSKSEIEGLKEVPLEEEKRMISGDDIRAWVGRSVNFEEKEVGSVSEATEKCVNEKQGADGIETFLKVASECLENVDLGTLEVPHLSKQGKKRKSGELIPAGSSKRANCTSDETRNKAISKKISQVKEAAASKIPNKLKMRRLSVAKRLSIARPGSRVTNPRPFRLRTQERGAVKEKEFIKKVEEYRAAKEGFHSAFQGLAVSEPKIPGKFSKPAHVFSAKRAEPQTQDHEKDGEAKVIKAGIPPAHKAGIPPAHKAGILPAHKAGIPPGHRAPLFDHPFKPHRSTKKLTVPQEPKFHTTRGRNCPTHTVAAA